MKKILILLLTVLIVIGLAASSIVRSEPYEQAVIVQAGEPIRILEGNTGWRIPFLQQAVIFNTAAQIGSDLNILENLEDGQTCNLSVFVASKIEDPVRTYNWIKASSETPNYSSIPTGLSEASQLFETELRTMIGQTSSLESSRGSIENWISEFAGSNGGTVLPDGTRLHAVRLFAIDCSAAWAEQQDASD